MGIPNAVTVLSHPQLIILHKSTPAYWAAQGGRTNLAEDSGDHDPEAEDVRHGQVENEGQDEGRRWQPIAGKLKLKSFMVRRRIGKDLHHFYSRNHNQCILKFKLSHLRYVYNSSRPCNYVQLKNEGSLDLLTNISRKVVVLPHFQPEKFVSTFFILKHI